MNITPITKPVHHPLHMDVFYLGYNYHQLKSALQPTPGGRLSRSRVAGKQSAAAGACSLCFVDVPSKSTKHDTGNGTTDDGRHDDTMGVTRREAHERLERRVRGTAQQKRDGRHAVRSTTKCAYL